MTKHDMIKLLGVLENPRSMKRMRIFDSSTNFECPWLRWLLGRIDEIEPLKIRGILMMQDWDCEKQSLCQAIEFIKEQLGQNPTCDKTTNNLFGSNWRNPIENGEILVTNAAWGIRSPKEDGSQDDMCGYLGAEIHKTAFLTWGKLVSIISQDEKSDDFRLFMAGEWARFDNQKNKSGEPIAEYLIRWRNWAARNSGRVDQFPDDLNEDQIKKCKGRVIFLSHPSTWNFKYVCDPFAKFDPLEDAAC